MSFKPFISPKTVSTSATSQRSTLIHVSNNFSTHLFVVDLKLLKNNIIIYLKVIEIFLFI